MHHPSNSTPIPRLAVMRSIARFCVALLSPIAMIGCREKGKPAESATELKADHGSVTVPADAPQNSSLAVEAAQPLTKAVAHVTGRLVWNEETTVRVFCSVAGRVNQINVNAGQHVAQGDTLATMASVDFGQAQADASKAAADLKLAERTLKRLTELFAHGAAAKKDVEVAEDDFENKKAERARSLARLKLYGVTTGTVDGMFPLKAPLAGTVVEKNINPGQEVRPDQMLANDAKLVLPLFVISTPSRLSVILDVTELDISALKPGQKIQIHSRAFPDRVFEGKLEFIGDSLDPLTRTVKARGFVDNSEGLLKAEMYVGVDVLLSTKDGEQPERVIVSEDPEKIGQPRTRSAPVEIPVKAVFSKDNRHFVFVEKSPGKFERQAVEVGGENDGRVAITSGVIAGERVVTQGSLLLQAMTEAGKD